MGELMSIGEFSALCQLSVKMLRHYDDIGLLEPAHVDPITGYRYYQGEQAGIAASIHELRRLDMPLGEIRSLLGAAHPGDAHDVLARHRRRLADQLVDAERRLALVERLVSKESPMANEITEVDLPSLRVVSRTVEGPQAMFLPLITAAFMELFAALQHQGVEPEGPPIQVVHSGNEERFEHEACFPIGADKTVGADIGVHDLQGGPAAVLRHSGPLEEGDLVVHSVFGWLQRKGHKPLMPFRVALLAMPPLFTLPEFTDANEPVVEIAVPFR